MKQLSLDEGNRFPLARESLERDLYMDDFLTGSHDLDTARLLRSQLSGLLMAGGFHLRKWVTNNLDILDEIPAEDRLRPTWVDLSTEGPVNELGVGWDPVADRIRFRSPPVSSDELLTKRKALAELTSVFDPAGWLTPMTLTAKLIIQDLWRAKLDWDKPLPSAWIEKWSKFRASVQNIAKFSIPRWIDYTPTDDIQLHAFSDASRRALAAAVYSRVTSSTGECRVLLLGAKSKLASIKSLQPPDSPRARMTIPRLELRATLIAAQLLQSIAAALSVPLTACHLWSDSEVALHWLRSNGPVGNDLVDNLIAHVQKLTVGVALHHVPTQFNPADVASRETDANQLIAHPHWWTGPKWLNKDKGAWPTDPATAPAILADLQPSRGASVHCLASLTAPTPPEPSHWSHIEGYSSLGGLLRGTARAIRLLRRRDCPQPMTTVQMAELHHAYLTCVRNSQRRYFATEIHLLNREEPLKVQSALKALEPFVDNDGIIRVGGRLTESRLPYDERHPVLLDGRSHLALLVLRWGHERSLHGGFIATYARVIQNAWIAGGYVIIKRHIRQCVPCARIAARALEQGMASFPAARVTLARPFSRCGVDYAGPFSLCRNKGRGQPTVTVALFVCMCTKAVHLEAVGDLTTAGFLGVLTRLIGRRGRPAEIWSDNGTNFRGANLELQRLLREAEINWGTVEDSLAEEGVTWKFIPPVAPHFGGLWEAGVKSMKAHLQCVTAPRRLTYEEFSTLLVSVEMILNSRPLVPPCGDLGDLEALTSSHFLIGTSATSFPQPSQPDVNLSRVDHWELVQAMRDQFFDRWSREYLNTLLQRPKWKKPQPNLEIGDFVVVIDPSLLRPEGRWPLRRVIATHPGKDGLVRTVTVKTATGEYMRPIVKLARLPLHSDVEEAA